MITGIRTQAGRLCHPSSNGQGRPFYDPMAGRPCHPSNNGQGRPFYDPMAGYLCRQVIGRAISGDSR